jgi:hypothetical protein
MRFHQKDKCIETDTFRKDFTFGKFENLKATKFNQDNDHHQLFKEFSSQIDEKDLPQENKELVGNSTSNNEENNKDLVKSGSKDENNPKENNLNRNDIIQNKNICNPDSPVGNKENIRKENFYFDSSANSNEMEIYRQACDESNNEKMRSHDKINSVKTFDENEEKEKPSVNNENIDNNKDPKSTRDFKLNITRESPDSSFIDLHRNESSQGNEEDKFKANESLSSQKITANLDLNQESKKEQEEDDESSKYKESFNRGKSNETKIEKEFNISVNPKGYSVFNPVDEIKNPVNHGQIQQHKIKEELEFSKEFNLELISDLLFTNYLLEGSLSLKKMNNIILDYFNLYLGTIFHRIEENDHFSYSLLHEYLEDIFIRIYDIYLSNTFKNLQTSGNKEIWSISSNTITEELIDQIASNLFENNTLNITININKPNLLTFTQIKSQFISKYRHYFPGKEEIFEKTITENEIFNSKLIRMVQTNKEETISQIKEIINNCKSNINAGKIITRSIIYDYKKFYVEYFDLNKQNEEVFSFTDNLSCNKSIDSLVNSLKYKQNGKLKSLNISSNMQGKLEFPLGKLINAVLFYARDLKHFSLTEAKSLNTVQQNILLRLLDLSNLSSLDLSHNMIGDAGIRLITDCLKLNNYSLKVLDISFNGLTSNSGYYLGELLYLNKTLEKLFLGGNNIIELGLHSMLNILSNNNRTLKTLDLSNNKLLHTDLSFISNLVSKNIELSTLNISMNSFESDSLSMLSEALKYNKYLKVLIMNQVNLNEDSSPYFLQHLNETNLSELYLENNHLNEIGGILFSNIIKHNKSISMLSLKKCELNEMAISCIAKALESNKTLRYLNLEENKFDEETLGNLISNVKEKNIKIYISMAILKNSNLSEEIKKSDNFMVIN